MWGRIFSIITLLLLLGSLLPRSHAASLDSACGDVIDTGSCTPKSADAAGNTNFKSEYCVTACQADHSKTTAHVHTAIWSASAAVCLAACIPQPLMSVSATACEYSFLGASVGEIVASLALEKDGQSAIETLIAGTLGVGTSVATGFLFPKAGEAPFVDPGVEREMERDLAGNGPGPKVSQKELSPENDPKAPEPPKKGFDAASCIRAGMAGIKVGMAIARAGSTGSLRDARLKDAQDLTSSASDLVVAENSRSNSQTNHVLGAKAVLKGTPVSSTPKTCIERFRAGLVTNVNLCLDDKNQLQGATDSVFRNGFRDLSKQDLNDHIRKTLDHPPNSAGEAVAAAFGPGGAGLPGLSGAFNEFTKKYDGSEKLKGEESTGSYAGGRAGGSGPPSEPATPDFQALMSGMLSQLMPKPADDSQGGMSPELAKLETRSSKEIEEDRELSLFTRVEFRYRKSLNRVEPLPYSAKFNQMVRKPASR